MYKKLSIIFLGSLITLSWSNIVQITFKRDLIAQKKLGVSVGEGVLIHPSYVISEQYRTEPVVKIGGNNLPKEKSPIIGPEKKFYLYWLKRPSTHVLSISRSRAEMPADYNNLPICVAFYNKMNQKWDIYTTKIADIIGCKTEVKFSLGTNYNLEHIASVFVRKNNNYFLAGFMQVIFNKGVINWLKEKDNAWIDALIGKKLVK